jgi:glycine/D-amino acid oxidase-like deaminating enzyme
MASRIAICGAGTIGASVACFLSRAHGLSEPGAPARPTPLTASAVPVDCLRSVPIPQAEAEACRWEVPTDGDCLA